jgi:mycothiol synthase
MDLTVVAFEGAEASEEDLHACYELMITVLEESSPDLVRPAFAAYVQRMRTPATEFGPRRDWLARDGSRLVATASVVYPDRENLEYALVNIRVLPESRRHGIASALLREIVPDLRARERTIAWGQARSDTGAQGWAEALGFAAVSETAQMTLTVNDVDPQLWQVPTAEGFRLEQWADTAPEELVDAYAAACTAITDAPDGERGPENPEWTADRVREHERATQAADLQCRVVVAVDQATAAIAGLTEARIAAGNQQICHQGDTAVLARLRGRGLGLCVKAAMMRWLTAEQPGLKQIITDTAADNSHMIRVNRQLGYVLTHTMIDFEADTEVLAARLAAARPSHIGQVGLP